MKIIRCLVILCFLHSVLIAQKSIDPGYIIQHDQDTVTGFIEITSEVDLCRSVKFKKENEEFREFTPLDISGFGIGNEVYRRVQFLNTTEGNLKTTAFLKQLVTGEYNLYVYVLSDRRFYLLQKDSTQYFLHDLISKDPGQSNQTGNYYNYLHFISVSCDKLSNLYDRVGFNDQALADFVLKVDNCISQGKATSFYQKPKTIIHPYVFVGGFPVSGMEQFTANFILRFTIPRVDKKTSMNVGLNFSNTIKESSERSDYFSLYTLTSHYQIYSIPITCQYNFTNTQVQPYFYAGISAAYLNKTTNSYTFNIPRASTNFGVSLVAGIGIEAKVVSRLFIKADWRYEVIMQYPAIGLAYQF
jgi:opacity protein-like surface antigen